MEISSEQVLAALRNVEDPDFKKDLVTLNMIKDLVIEDKKVSFTLELTTPACPMKDMLKNACLNAIKHFVNQEAEVENILQLTRQTVCPTIQMIILIVTTKWSQINKEVEILKK